MKGGFRREVRGLVEGGVRDIDVNEMRLFFHQRGSENEG